MSSHFSEVRISVYFSQLAVMIRLLDFEKCVSSLVLFSNFHTQVRLGGDLKSNFSEKNLDFIWQYYF